MNINIINNINVNVPGGDGPSKITKLIVIIVILCVGIFICKDDLSNYMSIAIELYKLM